MHSERGQNEETRDKASSFSQPACQITSTLIKVCPGTADMQQMLKSTMLSRFPRLSGGQTVR